MTFWKWENYRKGLVVARGCGRGRGGREVGKSNKGNLSGEGREPGKGYMKLLCIIFSCMRIYNDLKIKQESDNVCAAWARTW